MTKQLKYFLILLIALFNSFCNSQVQSKSQIDKESNKQDIEKSVQQEAFEALNTLQTSTTEKNRLYSTFANVDHPFYPADTSFFITQPELLDFFKQFVSKYCQNLSKDMRDELTKSSVLAQEEYTVLYCNNESANQNFKNGLPMSGTWVLPNILGRRDMIIVW